MNVILLCGGKGLRLRPITEDIPKPMANLNGKPILYYILDHLKNFEIKKVTVSIGYKANKIKNYLLLSNFPLEIETSNAGDVDIIKRIINVTKYLNEDFIVLYGDTISNVNLNDLKNFHFSHDKPVTMSVWPFKLQFGVVSIDENSFVTNFNEKPKNNILINIGYFYFSSEMINKLEDFDTFEQFLIYIANEKKLAAYQHNGEHVTVNSIQELEEAERYLASREITSE